MLRKDVIERELINARHAVEVAPVETELEYLTRQEILEQPEMGLFTENQVKAIAIAYSRLQTIAGGRG